MRLQRTHADLLSQGKGLAVVGFGLVDVRGLATPGDLAEEPAGSGISTLWESARPRSSMGMAFWSTPWRR
jgi:hypothetical protein